MSVTDTTPPPVRMTAGGAELTAALTGLDAEGTARLYLSGDLVQSGRTVYTVGSADCAALLDNLRAIVGLLEDAQMVADTWRTLRAMAAREPRYGRPLGATALDDLAYHQR